ncbi:5-formyltetrahydrofolate cyclo-ligase [Corynebacterium heidelbergense]|uniref:5-formyltetrahydrofolate cyclo-ligase n=2 Tax=Corynebacterium heidelbergense TaxID=2055947 RepID=A0A364V691_9CORY|nr:5-formyltetrahydrofolate cyclo-ligase [Corynebacterium heidelbergense]
MAVTPVRKCDRTAPRGGLVEGTASESTNGDTAMAERHEAIAEDKRRLRTEIRRVRRRLNPEARRERDGEIQRRLLAHLAETMEGAGASGAAGLIQPATVLAFAPMEGEPGGTALPQVLSSAGYQVLLPRIDERALEPTLLWVPFRGPGDLACNRLGIPEPQGQPVPDWRAADVAAAIVPALAIDGEGIRLGQGGGFYDRVFASSAGARPCVIGLVGSDELVNEVPSTCLDMRVDAAVTPAGVRRFGK